MGAGDGGRSRQWNRANAHHWSELKAVGSETFNDHCLALIAAALGRTSAFDVGLRTIDESFPFFERTGQRFYEAEVHRLKGELLLARTHRMPRKRSNPSAPRSKFRAARKRSRGSCARRPASHACSKSKASATRRARCSPTSTTGSPRASTPPTLKDAKSLLDELSQ